MWKSLVVAVLGAVLEWGRSPVPVHPVVPPPDCREVFSEVLQLALESSSQCVVQSKKCEEALDLSSQCVERTRRCETDHSHEVVWAWWSVFAQGALVWAFLDVVSLIVALWHRLIHCCSSCLRGRRGNPSSSSSVRLALGRYPGLYGRASTSED